jgi:Na+-driven multidrug efflux pump
LTTNAVTGRAGRLRELFDFAWPICAANILFPLSGSLTTIWVGKFLGESDFAVSLTAFPVAAIVAALLGGVSAATGVLVAQSLGAQEPEKAARVMRVGMLFQACATLIVCGAAVLGASGLLALLGLNEQQVAVGTPYLQLQLIALLPNTILNLVNAYLRAHADSKTGLRMISLAIAIHVVATPPLVFGVGSIPGVGLKGTAVADCFAYTIALCWLFRMLARKQHPIIAAMSSAVSVRPVLPTIRWIVPRGLAFGLQSIVTTLAAIAVTVTTNEYGSVTTAAFGAAAQLWGYVGIPVFAIGIALSNLAAREFGAGNFKGVDALLRSAFALGAITILPLLFVGYAFGGTLLKAFLPSGSASLPIAVAVNSTVLWAFLPHGVASMVLAVCKAAGAAYVPLLISILGLLGIRVVILFLFRDSLDSDHVAWSISISMVAFMVMSTAYFLFAPWKKKN